MTRVATYSVLRDASFDLDEDQVRRFTVTMPSSFDADTAAPMLCFRLHQRSKRLKFLVILNDAPGDANVPSDKIEFLYDFDGSSHRNMRTLNEVLNGQKFVIGENTIDFRVVAGEATFSDVVLFHRLEV